MVLSDGEIRTAISEGRIIFDPALDSSRLATALATSALDLRLGHELHFYKSTSEAAPQGLANPVVIDPTTKGVIPDLILKWGLKQDITGSFYDLIPHSLVLGTTEEKISLPREGRIAARVEGKSTLARLGFVVHMTAPTIHAGFVGKIVLEMYNFGPYAIRLTHGMSVCQLIFEELGTPAASELLSQYHEQTGPGSSI